MIVRKVIYADEGKVLTDGEAYGTQIFLEEGKSENNYYEISQKEYEAILNEKEIKSLE